MPVFLWLRWRNDPPSQFILFYLFIVGSSMHFPKVLLFLWEVWLEFYTCSCFCNLFYHMLSSGLLHFVEIIVATGMPRKDWTNKMEGMFPKVFPFCLFSIFLSFSTVFSVAWRWVGWNWTWHCMSNLFHRSCHWRNSWRRQPHIYKHFCFKTTRSCWQF